MYNFVFQNTTKVYFGDNQLSHLGEEVKQFGTRVPPFCKSISDCMRKRRHFVSCFRCILF